MLMARNPLSFKSLKMQGFSQPRGLASPGRAESVCLSDPMPVPSEGADTGLDSATVHAKEVRTSGRRPFYPALARQCRPVSLTELCSFLEVPHGDLWLLLGWLCPCALPGSFHTAPQ